jgi:S1-C subfamily serine protease
MKQSWIQLTLLVGAMAPAALAQEPRTGAPPPAERVRGRSMMATPEEIDRVYYFNTNRGKMGVTISILPLPTDTLGALVDAVSPGSPAFKAGIQSGDVITRFNGRSLIALTREASKASPGLTLLELASTLSAGDTARMEFRRGAHRRNATMVLEPASEYTMFSPSITDGMPRTPFSGRKMELRQEYVGPEMAIIGSGEAPEFFQPFRAMARLELAPMNPGLGQYFGVTTGVLVINIPEGSQLNLRSGDVVTMVDGRRVSSPNQFFRILRSYDGDERFRFEIVRMKRRETVTASIAER